MSSLQHVHILEICNVQEYDTFVSVKIYSWGATCSTLACWGKIVCNFTCKDNNSCVEIEQSGSLKYTSKHYKSL